MPVMPAPVGPAWEIARSKHRYSTMGEGCPYHDFDKCKYPTPNLCGPVAEWSAGWEMELDIPTRIDPTGAGEYGSVVSGMKP